MEITNTTKLVKAKSNNLILRFLISFFMLLSTLLIGADLWAIKIGISIRIDQFFLVISAILMIIYNKFYIRKNIHIFLFVILSGISVIFAFNFTRGLLFYFSILFNVIFLFYLYSNYVTYFGVKKILELYRKTIFISFVVLLVQFVLMVLFKYELPFLPAYGYYGGIPRFRLWFYEPSYMAIYLMFWFGFTCYMFLIKKVKKYIYDIIICFIMILITTSTSGFIGIAVILLFVYFIWLSKGVSLKKASVLILLIIAFLVFRLVFSNIYDVFIARLFNSSLDTASGGRINAWTETINVFKEKPLFGVGPGNYGLYLGEEAGYVPSNITLELLATVGIFATIAFYMITVDLVIRGYKLYKLNRKKFGIIPGLLFALIAFTILLQINQGYLRLYHWMFFGIIDGAIHYYMRKYKIKNLNVRRKKYAKTNN